MAGHAYMKKLVVLAIAALLAVLPLCAQAEGGGPEILSAVWSDADDGIRVTFRTNGLEGMWMLSSFFGAADEPFHGGSGRPLTPEEAAAGECVVYSAVLVPGETFHFRVSVTTPDGQEYTSGPAEAAVPLTGAESPITVSACAVPDLDKAALLAMQEELLGLLIDGDFEQYAALCREKYYDKIVTADFEVSDIVWVLVISPGGDMDVFCAGPDPFGGTLYSFSHSLTDLFVSPFTAGEGQYTVRLYDWERKCLIGTYTFNVV